jgi:hypothetical protein
MELELGLMKSSANKEELSFFSVVSSVHNVWSAIIPLAMSQAASRCKRRNLQQILRENHPSTGKDYFQANIENFNVIEFQCDRIL